MVLPFWTFDFEFSDVGLSLICSLSLCLNEVGLLLEVEFEPGGL